MSKSRGQLSPEFLLTLTAAFVILSIASFISYNQYMRTRENIALTQGRSFATDIANAVFRVATLRENNTFIRLNPEKSIPLRQIRITKDIFQSRRTRNLHLRIYFEDINYFPGGNVFADRHLHLPPDSCILPDNGLTINRTQSLVIWAANNGSVFMRGEPV